MVLRAVAIAVVLLLMPRFASAWWNDDWTLRKSITLDTSATGAAISEPPGRVPVLVRLHDGVFPFASAMDNGHDLRFVAGDDETPLTYHLEAYDPLLGLGFVWVDIPGLKADAQTAIWLYYGNAKAADASDAAATYDNDTILAYHFAERNTPAVDATAYRNNAVTAGKSAEGALIGSGLRLDGSSPVTLPASPSLAVAAAAPMTLSLWAKMEAPQPNAVLYSRHDGANALILGVDQGVPFVQITDASGRKRSSGGAPLTAGTWQHLAMVADGQQITLLVDGVPGTPLAAALPALNTPAMLGGEIAPAAPPPPATTPPTHGATTTAPKPAHEPALLAPVGFVGDIDELQIAKVARPIAAIKARVAAEGAETRLVQVGADEETSSWLSGYFAILIGAVTIDGWVVIGVLAVMSVLSWIVMVSKVSFVNRQARANQRFIARFEKASGRLARLHQEAPETVLAAGGEMRPSERRTLHRSSLFRLFATGAGDLQRRFGGADSGVPAPVPVLESYALATIRARLDAQLVRETQRLNRSMVLLTIAISGGPFLGLLGTVIGVMITFAAIAAAGDVNVNAIAPGIAAALVATVAGLAVAIPALFGYNYLLTRVKDITADMRVFSDEYTTILAELYRPDRPYSDTLLAAE